MGSDHLLQQGLLELTTGLDVRLKGECHAYVVWKRAEIPWPSYRSLKTLPEEVLRGCTTLRVTRKTRAG